MEVKNHSPLFTLRGHSVSVTALAYFINENNPYLVSGDDEGTLIVWDLNTFKKFVSYPKVATSRIQRLKVVKIFIQGILCSVLIVQFRECGLRLYNLFDIMLNLPSELKELEKFPTYCPLFSRGDALNTDGYSALLAYPSCIENHLVTVRIIGDDAKTLDSGTALRFDSDKKKICPIFDIALMRKDENSYLILIAYEDGCLCLFAVNLHEYISIPVVQVHGLKVDLIKTYDFQIGDFISAFDVISPEPDKLIVILGSPHKDLIFLCDSENQAPGQQLDRVEMKKRGVSVIKVRSDNKLVAVACWDSSVRLYSVQSRKHLATLNHHSKQVQSILFIDDCPEILDNVKHLLCCASSDGTISITVD